jgi:hypothetical protein
MEGGSMSDTPETDKAEDSDPIVEGEWHWIVPSSFARRLERERDEAREAAKLAYSILGKINKQSLEIAAWSAGIKHINNTPMDWLKSIVQKWEEAK